MRGASLRVEPMLCLAGQSSRKKLSWGQCWAHTWSLIHQELTRANESPFFVVCIPDCYSASRLGDVFQIHRLPKETSHSPVRATLQTSGVFLQMFFLSLLPSHRSLGTFVIPLRVLQEQGHTDWHGRKSEVISLTSLLVVGVAVPAFDKVESGD